MTPPRWTELLDDEETALLKRFVLASGSLKELAEAYGVSYPTVRLRVDRLIEKVKILDSPRDMDRFERVARSLAADGKLDASTLKTLLNAHLKTLEDAHATRDDGDDGGHGNHRSPAGGPAGGGRPGRRQG